MTPTLTPHPAIAGVTEAGHPLRDVLTFCTGGYWIDANHWLHGPDVTVAPVEPESYSQPIIAPWSSILHTNAGPRSTPWWNLVAYWRRSDITGEAHLQIGYDESVQAIPFNRRADCNYRANRFQLPSGRYVGAISFETQDNGAATLDATPWNVRQLGAIVGIQTALCVCYGIWCTAPATWDDSGIGHHSLFREWSSYAGKTCPGAARIRQMDWIRADVARRLSAYADNRTGYYCGKGRPA